MRPLGQTQHVAGWVGGLLERAEPDRATRDTLNGRLRSGENFVHGGTGRLAVRGGARAALTLAQQSISDLVALHRFSPTGAILVAHSATNDKHYAYALTPEGTLALPINAATEAGSRVDLGWNVANPRWAQGVELFETLFLADTSDVARQTLKRLKLTSGTLTVASVQADLDANSTPADMKPSGLAVYGSVLFAYGWEDEAVGAAPHILRHSLLGQDPSDSAGWNADAYATIGAQGEPIRGATPGQDILLVAKYTELFRVFGDPDANPGWQFQIQPVNASLRVGAVNQHAMCYEADRWWGIGRDGPWMFDGRQATSLVGSRRERWGQVGDLASAFVEPHPRRSAVLFGFPEPASLVSGQRASRFWVFDTATDSWAPDLTFPSRFWMTRSIAQTGVELDTIPDALAWVSDGGAYEFNALTLRFTPGDASAQTEVWIEPTGGSLVLAATLAAGVGGGRLSGLPRGTSYAVKVRHRKGDAVTEFGASVPMYTRIDPPRLLGCTAGVVPQWSILLASNGDVTWNTTNGTGANGLKSLPDRPAGTLLLDYTVTDNAAGTGYGTSPFLNTVVQVSDGVNTAPSTTYRHPHWAPSSFQQYGWNGIAVSQQFDESNYSLTAINLLVSVQRPNSTAGQTQVDSIVVRYNVVGSSPISELPPVPITYLGNAATVQIQIPNLQPNLRYEVAARLEANNPLNYSIPQSTTVVMFTQIAPPTATIATAGAGTPVTNITVTPPGALPNFDTKIVNINGLFDATYVNVPTTPTSYQSTQGNCGVTDTYYVRARNLNWPSGFQHSLPVQLTIANPCVISP